MASKVGYLFLFLTNDYEEKLHSHTIIAHHWNGENHINHV